MPDGSANIIQPNLDIASAFWSLVAPGEPIRLRFVFEGRLAAGLPVLDRSQRFPRQRIECRAGADWLRWPSKTKRRRIGFARRDQRPERRRDIEIWLDDIG